MTKELKNARDKVLVDNTAQAVFKHLDRIKDNRSTLGARWIWELLQNARDAAGPQGVRIRVHVSATECRFEHNGKPFASEEIAHLVYHGSTKIDFKDIGQFGSGFLATHLLSKIIRVAGRLEDSSGFDFPLDRTGGTAEELREAMDRSWAAFEQSVEDPQPAPDATTSFAYKIAEPGGRELVETGMEELRRSGPLVLAFCPEITEIAVETSDAEWKLSRESQEAGGTLKIRYVGDGGELSCFVAVAGAEGECCAALQLRPGESRLEGSTPRRRRRRSSSCCSLSLAASGWDSRPRLTADDSSPARTGTASWPGTRRAHRKTGGFWKTQCGIRSNYSSGAPRISGRVPSECLPSTLHGYLTGQAAPLGSARC